MFRRFAWSFTFVFAAACGGSVSETPTDDTGVAADATPDTSKTDSGVDSTQADTATPDTLQPDTLTPVEDTGMTTNHEGGVPCGSTTCTGSDVCCASGGLDSGVAFTCAASCTGGGTIACGSPDNCGGNPCCTQISQSSTSPGALCTASPSACEPKLDIVARGVQTRLCRNDADCTSGITTANLPSCCSITYQGNTFKGCFNKSYASLVGSFATIVCP